MKTTKVKRITTTMKFCKPIKNIFCWLPLATIKGCQHQKKLYGQHPDEVLAGSDLKKVTHCTDGGREGGGREEGVALTLETFGPPGRGCKVRWGSKFLQPQFQSTAFRIDSSYKIGSKNESLKIGMKVLVFTFTSGKAYVCLLQHCLLLNTGYSIVLKGFEFS